MKLVQLLVKTCANRAAFYSVKETCRMIKPSARKGRTKKDLNETILN